jgi:hypothetical protein
MLIFLGREKAVRVCVDHPQREEILEIAPLLRNTNCP